ncbi:MAG TPA: hypothetical protein VK113_07405 [Gemmatimonadales bacterium]|nr:hypothetical protein [Gemmatimonadales bacterium]
MKVTTARLVGLAALGTLALACNPDTDPVGPALPSFERSQASAAPLFRDSVAPQATDPAIDRALDRHYVWLDTTARSNHKLFVFMPGRGQRPAMFQRVPEEAARLGYHVIGLMYPNDVSVLGVCSGQPDPNTCYENLHSEILDGVDRSPFVNVNPANSVVNRLTKLLQFLAQSFPDQGWSRFLAGDEPKWSRIAISGHSQGGAQAAMIAKLHLVARVVLFSSVVDRVGTLAPSWVATHVTPSDRYWGLAHDRDGNFGPIRAGWDSIGMAAFGPALAPETSAPPYGFTHMLVTNLVPQGGFVGTNAHGSPSNDVNTPLNPDGSCCRLRDAWRYLLRARSSRAADTENETSSGSATRKDP